MAEVKKRRRAPPNRKESAVSYLVLVALMVIAGGIWIQQADFDPNPWRPVTTGKDPTVARPATPDERNGSSIEPFLTAGLDALGGSETFDTQTLSDKIDGKADLYLKAGFKALTTARLRFRSEPAHWFEIFLFDMEDSDAAFSVYSQQKRTGAVALDFVRDGYRAGNAVFFISANRYVEMIGAAAAEPLLQAMVQSAEQFLKQQGVSTETGDPRRLFPESDLIAGSPALLAADAFGFDRFNHVYVAQYRIGADELTGFVKECGSPEEAAELARAYGAFLENFGAKLVTALPADATVHRYRLFESHETVFSVGRYLAGVHEGPAQTSTETLTASLRNRLEEATHE